MKATLVVMSRVPRPGETKTRLARALGDQDACAFHVAALGDLLERMGALEQLVRVVAWTGPFADDETCPDVPPGFQQRLQGPGDLGERMLRTARAVGLPVVFLGADAPTVPPAAVDDALGLLADGCDAVFQPAIDGGYTLAGFGIDPEPLVMGIPWGTDAVMEKTLIQCETSGLTVGLLDPWYDVDTEADLRLLRHHLRTLEQGGDSLPRMKRFLQRPGSPS